MQPIQPLNNESTKGQLPRYNVCPQCTGKKAFYAKLCAKCFKPVYKVRKVKRPTVAQPEDQSIRHIALTRGKIAIVSTAKFEWSTRWNWFAHFRPNAGKFYAARHGDRSSGETSLVYLHCELLPVPKGKEVDHINGNTLDNRMENLRAATRTQNSQNVPLRRDSTSGFKGVYWSRQNKKWIAHIKVNGKFVYLGGHDDKITAARAYNKAAIKYFGEFARLNQIP